MHIGVWQILIGRAQSQSMFSWCVHINYYRALRVDLPSEYVRLSPGSRSVRKVDLRVSGIRVCWSLPLPSLFTRECEYPLHAVKSEQDAPMVRV